MEAGHISLFGSFDRLAIVDQAADAPGVDAGSEFRGETDHGDDAIDGGPTHGRVRMCEVEMVGGEDLAGGDAGNLESSVGKALFHARDIDFAGVKEGKFNAVVTQFGSSIDAMAQIIAKDDEGAGECVTRGYGDSDFHSSPHGPRRAIENSQHRDNANADEVRTAQFRSAPV
jgi:hypothetical protein